MVNTHASQHKQPRRKLGEVIGDTRRGVNAMWNEYSQQSQEEKEWESFSHQITHFLDGRPWFTLQSRALMGQIAGLLMTTMETPFLSGACIQARAEATEKLGELLDLPLLDRTTERTWLIWLALRVGYCVGYVAVMIWAFNNRTFWPPRYATLITSVIICPLIWGLLKLTMIVFLFRARRVKRALYQISARK